MPLRAPEPVEKFIPLFRRESNGVAVRAYRLATPPPPPGVDPACAGPTSFVQAELSTAAAVGMLFAPEPAEAAKPQGATVQVLAADSFGVSEGEPATAAVVRSGPGVATVRITTPAGSDTMAPQDGITVLAVGGLADKGNIEGLGADGRVVATRPIIPAPEQPSAIDGGAGKGDAEKLEVEKACTIGPVCGPPPPPPAGPDLPMPMPMPAPMPPATIVGGSGSTKQVPPDQTEPDRTEPASVEAEVIEPDRIQVDDCNTIINGDPGSTAGPATTVAPSVSSAPPSEAP